jgi:hypothetical protein
MGFALPELFSEQGKRLVQLAFFVWPSCDCQAKKEAVCCSQARVRKMNIVKEHTSTSFLISFSSSLSLLDMK